MKQIFLSHPFGGNRDNLFKVMELAAYLTSKFDNALFVVPWVPLCMHWPDEGDSRKRGLALSVASVLSCDGFLGVELNESAGGRKEFDAAIEARMPWCTFLSVNSVKTKTGLEYISEVFDVKVRG